MNNLEKQIKNLPKKKLGLRADFLIRYRIFKQSYTMALQVFFDSIFLKKGLVFFLLLALIFSGTSVYAYSSPTVSSGHELFPLKKSIENIEIIIASSISQEKEVETYSKMADRRVEEFVKITENVNTQVSTKTTEKLIDSAQKAAKEIVQTNKIIEEKSQKILDETLEKKVIDSITENQLKKIEAARYFSDDDKIEREFNEVEKEINDIRENYRKRHEAERGDREEENNKDSEENNGDKELDQPESSSDSVLEENNKTQPIENEIKNRESDQDGSDRDENKQEYKDDSHEEEGVTDDNSEKIEEKENKESFEEPKDLEGNEEKTQKEEEDNYSKESDEKIETEKNSEKIDEEDLKDKEQQEQTDVSVEKDEGTDDSEATNSQDTEKQETDTEENDSENSES